MVGCIRVIWHQEQTAVAETIRSIARAHQLELPDKPQKLSAQKDFVRPELIAKIPIGHPNVALCEPGRFILLPAVRSVGLAQFVVECAMTVICAHSPIAVGVIDCGRSHREFYRKNGFDWLGEQYNPNIPSNHWNLLMISAEGVGKQLPDLQQRIQRFREKGCLEHDLGHLDWGVMAYFSLYLRRWLRRHIRKARKWRLSALIKQPIRQD